MDWKKLVLRVLIAVGAISAVYASAQWQPAYYLPGCNNLGCPDYYTIGHDVVKYRPDYTPRMQIVYSNSQIQAISWMRLTGGYSRPSAYLSNCNLLTCYGA